MLFECIFMYQMHETMKEHLLSGIRFCGRNILSRNGTMADITGWQGIFWVLFLIGILLLAGSIHFNDTLPAEKRGKTKWIDVYHGLITVLHNRSYVCYILQSGFAQSVLFANIASSPFIMQQHYGFTPFMFSVCFGINAIAIGIAAASAAKFRHPEQALYTGSIGMVLASVCLFIAFYSNCSFWVYETLLIGLLLMLGLTFTASNTLAMDSARSNAGIASALLGVLGFAFGGLVSPLVGLGNILISTGLVFIIGSLGSFICTLRALNRKFSLAKILKTTQSSMNL